MTGGARRTASDGDLVPAPYFAGHADQPWCGPFPRMTIHPSIRVKAGVLACLLACAGDMVVPVLLAHSYPGYDGFSRSESMLGSADSPVAVWFTVWSVCLAVLFFVFAWGMKQAFRPGSKRWGLAPLLLVFYGLGEGLGSGLFPDDPANSAVTLSGGVHSAMSILGSGALYLLPLVWLWDPPVRGPRLKGLSVATLILVGLFMALFGAAKLGWTGAAGLWQRAYIAMSYIFLLALAWSMWRQAGARTGHVL